MVGVPVIDFRFYLSLFLRRLHYFLIVLFLGSAVGLTLAWVLPPVFKAEALLVVESPQIPGDMAASTVQTAATEQLQIIQQRILTRDRLIEMANRFRIYAPAPGEAPRLMSGDNIVRDLRKRIQMVVTGGSRSSSGQATLVRVGFEASSAQLAAEVANEVVTMILRENVSMRTSVAGQTLEFFTQEVARLDRELSAQGAEILAFKEAHQDALPDSLDFRRRQQVAAQERLLQLERDEAQLKDRRTGLVTLYETTGQVQAPAGVQSAEARQLQTLRDQLSTMLITLSPQNPKVKMLEAQVAQLEKVVAAQAAASGDGETAGLSPLEIQLADIDRQLKFLAITREQVSTELEELKLSIAATPGNAIALDKMERNYANTRAQYDRAVADKARAETGDTIEALAKGQRISVIEQAVAPQNPVSPNRQLIAAGGIFAGLAGGLALVLLIELTRGAVRRPADISAGLGIAPFASLPFLRTAGQQRRRRAVIAAAFALVILAIPAGLWVVHERVMPLDLLFERLWARTGLAALWPAAPPAPPDMVTGSVIEGAGSAASAAATLSGGA